MINMNGTGEESRKRQKRNSRESKRSNAEREWKGRGVAEGVCTFKKIIPSTGYLHTFFYLFYLATSSSFTVPFLLLRLYSRLFFCLALFKFFVLIRFRVLSPNLIIVITNHSLCIPLLCHCTFSPFLPLSPHFLSPSFLSPS